MVKLLFSLVLFCVLSACSDDSGRLAKMEERITALEKKADRSYTPGFGEFMGNIQLHHAKLWFAGSNSNWPLAAFEMDEIKETIGDLKRYRAERVETKTLPMIDPALERVRAAIEKKDVNEFKKSFTVLTQTCNQCHQAVNYAFNHVKIPDRPPVGNQVFKSEIR